MLQDTPSVHGKCRSIALVLLLQGADSSGDGLGNDRACEAVAMNIWRRIPHVRFKVAHPREHPEAQVRHKRCAPRNMKKGRRVATVSERESPHSC